MSHLIVTMGISGSGKSTYSNAIVKELLLNVDAFRVNMDELREWYTGDVSNQSQNMKVAQDSFAITEYLLRRGATVVFDSTATSAHTRATLLRIAKNTKSSTQLIILKDSYNLELCRNRVKKDLQEKVNRSNTLSDESILTRQYASFLDAMKVVHSEQWDVILEHPEE